MITKKKTEGVGLLMILGLATIGIIGWVLPVYHMNFGPKISGPTTVQSLSHLPIYCTGVTSKALTTTSTDNILISGEYAMSDQNVTGQIYQIVVWIGATQPTTTFAQNNCSTDNLQLVALTLAPSVLHQIFTASFSTAVSKPAGTWFTWITVDSLATDSQIVQDGGNSVVQALDVK